MVRELLGSFQRNLNGTAVHVVGKQPSVHALPETWHKYPHQVMWSFTSDKQLEF